MRCAAVFEYPKAAEEIVKLLIPKLPQDIDTVMAPAIGESTWAMEVARILGCFVFAERDRGNGLAPRFCLTPGERVLVVEDVVTTGGSVKEVLRLPEAAAAVFRVWAALSTAARMRLDFQAPFVSCAWRSRLTNRINAPCAWLANR